MREASYPVPIEYPELVIGIAGPIGVDIELISGALSSSLSAVDYTTSLIKLTERMDGYPVTREDLVREVDQFSSDDTFGKYMRKMSAANALRKQYGDAALLARIGIKAIRERRAELSGDETSPCPKHAYIIRQFKRPEEINLLRRVYGRQFVLVSAYAPEVQRKAQICERLKRELSTAVKEAALSYKADQLIERDADEEDEERLGQLLRETFHLGDVFIHGLNKVDMDAKVQRFVEALFGRNDITPSKDEYGMYAARSASLRSADLSRQVGAAIFSPYGELITQGCNEVPKAHGGTYWDLETPDFRDIKKGYDPNEKYKKEILRDLIERLRKKDFLSEKLLKFGSDGDIIDELTARRSAPQSDGILVSSWLMDLTEYGRVVHAEMHALSDAARVGHSVRGATLYCTTFPCHNCTKHLLASGIKKVVYLEPYPKSKAKELHPDEIEIEAEAPDKMSFIPFMGISPFRYRDLFQKARRKQSDGQAQAWYGGQKRPMIETVFPSYPTNEIWALSPLLGELTAKTSAPERTSKSDNRQTDDGDGKERSRE